MRSSARLCAAADFGVRFSYVVISFCSASCIPVLRVGRSVPCCQYVRGKLLDPVQPQFYQRCKGAAPRAASFEPFMNSNYALEVELQRELHQPWITGALDPSKVRTIGGVPIGLEELRVVESVKEFSTEFEPGPFAERRDFLEADLPVVDARTAANGPRGVTNRPEWNGSKICGTIAGNRRVARSAVK